MTEPSRIAYLIARAIIHLNFNEPDEAIDALFDALTEYSFYETQSQSQSAAKEAA